MPGVPLPYINIHNVTNSIITIMYTATLVQDNINLSTGLFLLSLFWPIDLSQMAKPCQTALLVTVCEIAFSHRLFFQNLFQTKVSNFSYLIAFT